jgi:hypothetical protein
VVLQRIRGGRGVDQEYDTIRTSVEEEEKQAGGGKDIINSSNCTPRTLSVLLF